MLEFIDDICVKWLHKRKLFTKIDRKCGRYWSTNVDIENNSNKDIYVFILEEEDD